MPSVKTITIDNFVGIDPRRKTGYLWAGKSIDLENMVGSVSPSRHLSAEIRSDDTGMSGLGLVKWIRSFKVNSTEYQFLLDDNGNVWRRDGGTYEKETGYTAGGYGEGMATYGDYLYVFSSTAISRMSNSGTWTNSWQTGLQPKQHPATLFLTNLIFGNGRYLGLYDGATVSLQKLTLPSEYEIIDIKTTDNWAFIMANTLSGANSKVFVWDGVSSNFNAGIDVDSKILGGVAIGETIIVLTSNGTLRKISISSGVSILATFPSLGEEMNVISAVQDGIKFKNGLIYINCVLSYQNKQQHGIWVFNIRAGNLYCKYSFSKQKGEGATDADDKGASYVNGVGALMVFGENTSPFLIANAKVYKIYSSDILSIIASPQSNLSGNSYFIMKFGDEKPTEKVFQYLTIGFRNYTDNRKIDISATTSSNPIRTSQATYLDSGNTAVGDAIEVMAGECAGNIRFVSQVSPSVVVSEAFDNNSTSPPNNSLFCVYKFNKIKQISNSGSAEIKKKIIPLGLKGNSLWLMIYIRGYQQRPIIENISLTYYESDL